MIDEELLELSALCLPKRWYRHEEKDIERERERERKREIQRESER